MIGEVLAGILLGPSLLGSVSPAISARLFPAAVTPLLGILPQVGVLLFMFLIGLELNTEALRERTHAMVVISHASIAVPVIMALVTTLLTTPVLDALMSERWEEWPAGGHVGPQQVS